MPNPIPTQLQTPSRRLPFQGASNFRDLGGYIGAGGKAIRWRQLFRADRLSALLPADLPAFAELGIRTSVDFRGEAERQASDYAITGVQRQAIPIEPQVLSQTHTLLEQGGEVNAATMHRLMAQTYATFVREDSRQIRSFFDVMLAHDDPVVFHCTAGKDRTGFAAAMLLEALGVERSIIVKDYLLTNEWYQPPKTVMSTLPADALQVLWGVQADYLEAAYAEIERLHGSVQRYFYDGLGLDREVLAELQRKCLRP